MPFASRPARMKASIGFRTCGRSRPAGTSRRRIGSYDQWQPGNSLTPPGTPLFYCPGFGFGGSGYEGWLLYQPRVQYTDSYVRRAAFVNGKLDSFQTWYGESPPLP